ncbi:hypothetical protein [Halomarina pelagica]|uniref:hypothetical protein n=1 Tax=Halomarina pelagica TaxID=2961599 RepID=UPI003F63B612
MTQVAILLVFDLLSNSANGTLILTKVVLEMLERQKIVLGTIVPIAEVPDVPVSEVTVQGEITTYGILPHRVSSRWD